MEHAVNLGASHFISTVSPTPATGIIKKVHAALKKADGGPIDLDDLDAELGRGDDDDSGDDDDDDQFGVGDASGKALALVSQVSSILC